MNETLFLIYFPIWFALVIGTWLFFRGRDPAFKKRWYRHAYAFNITVIGGMIVLTAIPMSLPTPEGVQERYSVPWCSDTQVVPVHTGVYFF